MVALEFRDSLELMAGWGWPAWVALAMSVWASEQAEGGVAATPNPVGVQAHRAAAR